MPDKEERKINRRAHEKLREGKSPKTAAGPFVHEEIEHYKQGKHGRNQKQAIAIGISKARRHGIPYPGRGRKKGSEEDERTKKDLYNEAKRKHIRFSRNGQTFSGVSLAKSDALTAKGIRRGLYQIVKTDLPRRN
jgi:hypothetical protein